MPALISRKTCDYGAKIASGLGESVRDVPTDLTAK
jgi:hypothetical protein